jgi:hypothetical protein
MKYCGVVNQLRYRFFTFEWTYTNLNESRNNSPMTLTVGSAVSAMVHSDSAGTIIRRQNRFAVSHATQYFHATRWSFNLTSTLKKVTNVLNN